MVYSGGESQGQMRIASAHLVRRRLGLAGPGFEPAGEGEAGGGVGVPGPVRAAHPHRARALAAVSARHAFHLQPTLHADLADREKRQEDMRGGSLLFGMPWPG